MILCTFAVFGGNPFARGAGDDDHTDDGLVLPQPAIDLPVGKPGELKTAVFAGGCFWCTEAFIKELKGVTKVLPGYSGGTKETANYEAVCTGRTGHAEAIEITYDPSKITFGRLLRVFMAMHDPTTLNRQGPDVGTQYRSAVFYANEDEKRVTEAYFKQLTDAKSFDDPIVTTLEPLEAFYPAEAYHHDYAARNPSQGYIRQQALPKIDKVRKKFKDEVKQPTTAPGNG
jgi:peptide-methionine (S)-S-oxide reductase